VRPRRLSLTQPAVSNALRRARVLFQDELLGPRPIGHAPHRRAMPFGQGGGGRSTNCRLTRTRSFDPTTTTATFRVAITGVARDGLVSD